MKYLSDYIQKGQTELFDELGVFFAFGQKQFDEGKEKHKDKLQGQKFVDLGAGMFMPKANLEEFKVRHKALVKEAQDKDLAENGREGILQRECANYELCLSFSGARDENFRNAIEGYGFTEEEIQTAYKKYMDYCLENDLI